MKKLRDGLTVVVPVYNSAETLPELIKRLKQVLSAVGRDFEVILVDDGSSDSSWEVIESIAKSNQWVRGVSMMRNYGQHNATLAGVRAARYSITVTMDDDLQHPPEELPVLLGAMNDNVDVIYGVAVQEPHSVLRNVASVVTKFALQSATGADNAKVVSAWRLFRTDIRQSFTPYQSPFVSIDVLLTWGASRFGVVKVRHDQRFIGSSNYGFTKLLRHALNMMTGFSVFPLQVASVVGFVFTFFGFAVLAYVLGRFFFEGSSVQGFPFLASVIAIFSGAQLFTLGVIGEYLARMHFRIMDRPAYTVRKTVNESFGGPT